MFSCQKRSCYSNMTGWSHPFYILFGNRINMYLRCWRAFTQLIYEIMLEPKILKENFLRLYHSEQSQTSSQPMYDNHLSISACDHIIYLNVEITSLNPRT